MLDGLLRRGFSPKCKSLIKATKTRIEVLRRRSEAKQRFLKEDLAKLLANGLDINAFGRTEEFLAGMCLLSCYDFIEYSCEYILKWLSTMQKQRECPEECREPVSSLMFAAARFSDLPELRDLRDTFLERYGNSLEYFANHVFVEKLASRPPTVEKKIQLLQDISSEFSIKWDSKGFEKRMANPPAFTQDQPRKYGPSPVSEDKYALSNGNNSSTKSETTSNGDKPLLSKAETIAKQDTTEVSFRGRRDFSADKHYGSVNRTEDTNSPLTAVTPGGSSSSHGKRSEYVDTRDTAVHKGETKDPLSRRKGSDRVDGRNPTALSDWVTAPKVETRDPLSSGKGLDRSDCRYMVLNDRATVPKGDKDPLSIGNLEDKRETSKSYYNTALPPPYVKAKDIPNPNPPYIKQKGTNYGARTESNLVSHDSVKSSKPDQDHQNHIPLPKPRSVRRKNSKSLSSNHEEILNSEEGRVVKRTSSSRRKEHSRRGLQILFDDEHYQKDEEERMMDKLLLHYSKKSSNYDITKLRKKSEVDRAVNTVPVPARSVSLPHESPALSERPKVFARASSFDEPAPHVHPKLPNYDDLAAQFAALRGR